MKFTDAELDELEEETLAGHASVELEKRLEGLTPNDLTIAFQLNGALPALQRHAQGKEPVTRMQEETAVDCMNEAGRLRKLLWDRDTADVEKAFQLHRSLTAKRANKVMFFDNVISACKTLIGRRRMEEQRRLEEERRERERLAREEAERQRQAEADALAAQAAATGDEELLQAAIEVEQAPIVPVIVSEVAPAKMEGSSTTFKLVGTVRTPAQAHTYMAFLVGVNAKRLAQLMFDCNGIDFYTREQALEEATEFLANCAKDRGDMIVEAIGMTKDKEGTPIVAFSQSGVDAQLKRGLLLQDHGVDVVKRPDVRNLGRK